MVEDRVLYPVVARILGAPRATATMSRDHAAVTELARELAALRRELMVREVDTELLLALRRVLYGLYQLIEVHFSKEEEVFVPILEEGLTREEAERLVADMHDAARSVRGARSHVA
jgi:iron-sulfur cluster repair protein YtfE (RIC family)